MYSIAMSVMACIRAGTRVDLAWIIDQPQATASDPSKAMAITPGGGRLGSLGSEALEGQLVELAGLQSGGGRLLKLEIGSANADGYADGSGAEVECVLVPGSAMPDGLWKRLLDRDPVCLVSHLDGDTITDTKLHTASTIAESDSQVRRLYECKTSATEVVGNTVVTVLWPRSNLVVIGEQEATKALCQIASMLGWDPVATDNASEAAGLIANLSPMDSVVVMGHDLERAGIALSAALGSEVGYIGAVGSLRLQQSQADWLAYRGFTDLSRVKKPAGLNIGARTSAEIAVSIVAEIIVEQAADKD
jgi:xanthine dehydrogenase accessory factor